MDNLELKNTFNYTAVPEKMANSWEREQWLLKKEEERKQQSSSGSTRDRVFH